MTPGCDKLGRNNVSYLLLQVMAGVIVMAARYLQRKSDPDADFASLPAALIRGPVQALGGAFSWITSKITGAPAEASKTKSSQITWDVPEGSPT